MDSLKGVDVDYEHEVDTGDDDGLRFQDIPHQSSGDSSQTHEFTNFPHSAVDSDDEAQQDSSKLLNDDKAPSSSSFWTFAYYQQFFDVDTEHVGKRIIGSMFPKPRSNYLAKEIRLNPDLYGPFWICTTLVFTTAIAGNLANYFSSAGKDYHWKYDFHKVTFAATAIYSYWWFIPLILFGLLRWRGIRDSFTILEMICVYGYSLAIYVPISILWAIQVVWLQWTLVLVGTVLSGSVLLMNFWPAVSKENKKVALGIMAFIFIMHAALAAGFVFYFFYLPSPLRESVSPVPVKNATIAPHPVRMSDEPTLPKSEKLVSPETATDQDNVTGKETIVAGKLKHDTDKAINLKIPSSVITEKNLDSDKKNVPITSITEKFMSDQPNSPTAGRNRKKMRMKL